MIEKLNLVFPMAGDGSRFDFDFKPFKKLGDQTFIEHAVEPFYKWKYNIDKVYFIFRQDQEDTYQVSEYLKSNIAFDEDQIIPIIIPERTKGPRNTIEEALKQADIPNAIVCDCDHKIMVDKLFRKIIDTRFVQTVIPVWKIDKSESHNWSKVVVDGSKIVNIVEKEDVDFDKFEVWGILGCIYFADLKLFQREELGEYVSDVSREVLFSGSEITFTDVADAYFFGDPEMLDKCVNKRRNECSFFFDIDGVLIRHSDHSTNDTETNLSLKENIEFLRSLKNQNHKIVITTARSTKYLAGLKRLLEKLGIRYDHIVTGLASGPRILINDRKPSKPFTKQAHAFENFRNEPLEINVGSILDKNKETVLEDISANSGANTYIIQKDDSKVVRKIVNKNIVDHEKHVDVLKRQYRDLERFNHFSPASCPKTLGLTENNIECYYDMEFLKDYYKLDGYSRKVQTKLLKRVMQNLKENVYCYNKQFDTLQGKTFFQNFINEKIITKLNRFSSENPEMKKLIDSDNLQINGWNFKNLKELFNKQDLSRFAPKMISPVHGDLTLENILYNIVRDDYKLIDMDGAKLMDTHMLDLGKLSQSILSRYHEWNKADIEIGIDGNNFTCDPQWFEPKDADVRMLKDVLPYPEDTIAKCIFYMATYFVRFTPFRLKKGVNHGIFALIMSIVWLNKLNTWR